MFSEEVAVLQGALLLHRGHLKKDEATDTRETHRVVSEAVYEIIIGLWTKHTEYERDFWKFKLTTMLTLKIVEHTDMFAKDPQVSTLFSRYQVELFALPPVDVPLFLHVVQYCDLWAEVAMAVQLFPLYLCEEFLKIITQNASVHGDVLNSALPLRMLCQCILQMSEQCLCIINTACCKQRRSRTSAEIDMTSQLQHHSQDRGFVAGNNSLDAMCQNLSWKTWTKKIKESDHSVSKSNVCDVMTLCLFRITRCLANTEMISTKPFHSNLHPFNVKSDDDVHRLHSMIASSRAKKDIEIVSAVRRTTQALIDVVKEMVQIFPDCVKNVVTVKLTSFSNNLFVDNCFYGSCSNGLPKRGLDVAAEFVACVRGDIEQFELSCDSISVLKSVVSELEAFVESTGSFQAPEVTEDTAVDIGDLLRRSNELFISDGDLMELLRTANLQSTALSPDWLPCLERNKDRLVSMEAVLHLARLAESLYRLGHAGFACINQLLSWSFSQLPSVLQEAVLCHVSAEFSLPQREEVSSYYSDDEGRLTLTFNKLANSDSLSQKVLSEISSLAIWSPREVLRKAVESSTRNTGQAGVIVKLLQEFPSICSAQEVDGTTLMCSTVKSSLGMALENSTNQKNFVSFITDLLKPFENTASGPFTEPPLLEPRQLLNSVILPNLNRELIDVQMTNLIIKLLISALESISGNLELLNRDFWEDHLPPMVVCLGHVIDSCQLQLIDIFDHRCLEVKERSISAMALMKDLSKKLPPIHGKILTWLEAKCGDLHWTTKYYVLNDLNTADDICKLSVPAAVLELCRLSPAHWTVLPSGGDDQVPVLVNLLLLARLDSWITAAVGNLLDFIVIGGIANLYHSIVIALAQVLPISSGKEWERIVAMVKVLIDNRCLQVCVRHLNSSVLVFENLADVRSSLCLSQVLMDTLVVLSQSEGHVDWSHVMSCYSAEIKEIQTTLDQQTNPPDSSSSSKLAVLFAAEQIFSHICLLTTLVPPSHVENNLAVLALDWLMFYVCLNQLAGDSTFNPAILTAIKTLPESCQSALLKKYESAFKHG